MEIEVLKSEISHIAKKPDVWVVYMNSRKVWICEINGIRENEQFCVLKLATKGKCDRK